jgi:5-formyltetrahydrofolate cyclo-ligase
MKNISLAKEEIRRQILKQRALIQPTKEEISSLTSNLLTVVRDLKSSRVATYISYPSEPNTAEFIEALLAQEITVLVPKTLRNGILSWHNYTDESQESLSSADVLFLPALAVDEKGNRLGRGKGYFDRELSLVAGLVCYAVVFESEVLESIPVEAHDKSVDGVVTQERIRKIN